MILAFEQQTIYDIVKYTKYLVTRVENRLENDSK